MVVEREQPGTEAEAGCRTEAVPAPGVAGQSALAWEQGYHWCWPQRIWARWGCCCSCNGWGSKLRGGGTVGNL